LGWCDELQPQPIETYTRPTGQTLDITDIGMDVVYYFFPILFIMVCLWNQRGGTFCVDTSDSSDRGYLCDHRENV
tara:strand:- start:9 stop:233 length:225 start_codon:yes stop_codon:yes gene_type:complete